MGGCDFVPLVHPHVKRRVLTVGKSPGTVSYTHLDVYKRQGQLLRILLYVHIQADMKVISRYGFNPVLCGVLYLLSLIHI